jgi:ribonucleoside-diphosphate reductase alpha chain
MGSEPRPQPAAETVVSRGLVRGKVHALQVVDGTRGSAGASNVANPTSVALAVTSLFGATALKQETMIETRPVVVAAPQPVTSERPDVAKGQKIAEARMKGYEGESCPECANFTMVRNGTCLKCETCGSTSGCS